MTDHDDPLDRWPAVTRTVDPLPGGLTALRRRLHGDAAHWQTVSRTIEPLPGGLADLRRKLRAPSRARFVPAALAGAVAIAAVLAIITTDSPVRADRSAMKVLLGGHGQPHPGAAALGLVEPAPQLAAEDRRVRDAVVVFRWVEPITAPPSSQDRSDPR